MKRVVFAILLVFACAWFALFHFSPCNLQQTYTDKLQVPLFAGFLTLGSFLLTLKIFVIVKLKESLYDDRVYGERLRKMRLLKPSLLRYGPLNRLANFLVYTVIFALATSTAQLTIGFVSSRIAATLCLALATTTLCSIGYAWWLIKRNLSDLFSMWEESAEANQQQAAE